MSAASMPLGPIANPHDSGVRHPMTAGQADLEPEPRRRAAVARARSADLLAAAG